MGEKKTTNKLHTGNKRGIIELYNYKIGLHRCAAARQFSLFSFRSYSIGILLKKKIHAFLLLLSAVNARCAWSLFGVFKHQIFSIARLWRLTDTECNTQYSKWLDLIVFSLLVNGKSTNSIQ